MSVVVMTMCVAFGIFVCLAAVMHAVLAAGDVLDRWGDR